MASIGRSARSAFLDLRPLLPRAACLPRRAGVTGIAPNLGAANHVPNLTIQPRRSMSNGAIQEPQAVDIAPSSLDDLTGLMQKPNKPVVSNTITPVIQSLLPLLRSQPPHYITIHIHGRPYLITKGDTLRLPFLMPLAKPGDIIRLNRATHIGSRDYTLKAPQPIKGNADHGKKILYLDDRLFLCRARVVAIESEPMRVEEKTKRRQRHVKHVKSKLRFTVLKISELEVCSLEEYENDLE